MNDMLQTIKAKTDQLNFDDFIADQTKTVKIIGVDIKADEQPVSLHFEGDNGKPYKPCKSMCRVLVSVWGADAKQYAGRSLTLYGDPEVKFGGIKVGGIRISHMSHMPNATTLSLTASKAVRKAFTVQPLVTAEIPAMKLEDVIFDIENAINVDGLMHKYKAGYRAFPDTDARAKLTDAKDKRKAELSTTETPGDEARTPNSQPQEQ